MKMWDGRFAGAADKLADDFNGSLDFDKKLYKYDIAGSVAHATMLGERGIIDKADADAIVKSLGGILDDIESGRLVPANAEDIHMFVEEVLTERIGAAGKKLHTARSRNDQVALDLRMYLRDAIDGIDGLLRALLIALCDIAVKHTDTLIPAFTHMQKAQPTTLAHHLMAYAEMFSRDRERLADCRKRVNVMPLGACAATGTAYPIDRARVAELLGFDKITANSLDAVSDRDFAVEFLSACALIMTHLSRINEEIVYWASDEFGYVTLSDAFSTGSSIMPQKKNPDISELIRGKAGRCYGNLVTLLTVMKGLPLAYNKDMQEDKEAVFDSETTVRASLTVFTAMLPTLTFNADKLFSAARGGYTAATDCADYLVKKGAAFREAHKIVGGLVRYCVEKNAALDGLTLDDYKKFSPLFDADILNAVRAQNVVAARLTPGGASPESVSEEIRAMREKLKK
ncbi:MAG: argininosuccinate lyase [Clostridiales bacterium]|nr:argininosuccinate lyase [Clostridiales bacterium]